MATNANWKPRKTITKNVKMDVCKAIKCVLWELKDSKDAQVDDEVFEEFVEFATLITFLNVKFNGLIEVQQKVQEEKEEVKDLTKIMELELQLKDEEIQRLREETQPQKEEIQSYLKKISI
eukprot:gene2490-2866_t